MYEPPGRWNNAERPLYRWVPTIERILIAERLPELTGPLIYIFSDYSGDQKASSYETMGVLYADLYGSPDWEIHRREVRDRFLADGRRISFKAMSDKRRQAAIVPFLQAANEIEGLILVVAIKKSIRTLCVDAQFAKKISERLVFNKSWSLREFERMARVTHLIGLLIGGLGKKDQDIYWISDQDPLLANESIAFDLRQMLTRFSSHYARRDLGQLGFGTVAMDPGDRFEEDGAAIPDLVAGAMSEILTRLSTVAGGRIRPGIAIPFSGAFTPKTDVIHSWLTYRASRLRKVCIVFEDLGKAGLAVFRLDM